MSDSRLDLSKAPLPAPNTGAAAAQTQPTPSAATLTLEPPPAVEAVPQTQAAEAVKIDPAQQQKLDQMVSTYLDAVTSLDTHDQAFTARVNDIAKLGDDDIRASAQVSNRLLDKPMAEMSQGGISQACNVTKSLLSLRKTGRGSRPAEAGQPALAAQAARRHPHAATAWSTTSTSTSRARATSTRSSSACTTARTSCAATTPTSSRRRPTCGRRWAGCASTPTWPSSSTRA